MRAVLSKLLGLAMTAFAAAPALAQEATFYTVTYVEVVPPSTVQTANLLSVRPKTC
jgi:hypothetical protein